MAKAKRTRKNSNKAEKTTVKQADVGYDNAIPVWMFDKIDRNGESIAFDITRKDFDHREILDKMISFSSMTWAQLNRQTHDNGRSKNHILQVESLSKVAQNRIIAMHLEEDNDRLYSIALNNTLRVIGIRDKDRFHVLWYDPEHKVCPSKKKHT